MRYEQLHYVLEIAKTQSMRKAADNLYVTQPTLSEAIQRLEEELGFSLFTRMSNGTKLTTLGQQALPIIEDILNLTSDLKNLRFSGSVESANLSGSIIIFASHYFITHLLSEPLTQFSKYYPHITLSLSITSFSLSYANVVERKCDLAAISADLSFFKRLTHPEVIVEHLFKLPMYIFINANSPLAAKKSISLKDFTPEYEITVVSIDRAEIELHLAQQFKGYTIPRLSLNSSSFELMLSKICTNPYIFGLVYTLSPHLYAEKLSAKGIKILPLKEKRFMQFSFCYHKDKLKDPVFALLLDYLRQNVHPK